MPYLSRYLMSLASVLMLFGGFVVLSGESAAVHAAALRTTSAEDAIESAVSAFQEIGVLRKENPINADAIATKYTGALQALTKQADIQLVSNMDSDVLVAIDDIRNDNEPKLAAQVIDKTLQRVFFQTILERITSVRDSFDSQTTAELGLKWDEATAAFEAIRGTASRENKIISADRQSIETGDNPGLDIQITDALARGKTALNKENAAEDKIAVGIERQIIRLSLARAYYIGVLREVDGLIDKRERNLEGALINQKEGEFFYHIIEGFIATDNPTGNILIKSQLTGNVSNVVADEVISELSKGFVGRVKGELSANESSIGNDRERAMIVAEEALLYSNVFIPDLELRLGSTIRNDLDAALNKLRDASSEEDTTKAAEARQVITAILGDYENSLVLADYKKTNNTDFIDAAVSAFQAIGVLRKETPINADAITAEYTGELQQLTQLVDEVFALTLNNDIVVAIDAIKNGNQEKLAAQVIDKTLQRVFALAVYNRVTLVRDTFDNTTTEVLGLEWDQAYAAFGAIKGTAAREDRVLSADRQSIEAGSNPGLDSIITLAFIRGQHALSKDNVTEDKIMVAVESEVIVSSLIRAFFIGVLREIDGVIDKRERNLEGALINQKEGEFFYRIVEALISRDNPLGNDIIKAQLTGDVTHVVADQVISEISRGVIGYLSDSLDNNELTVGVDRGQAMVSAEQVSLYAGIVISDLELRLGALQRLKLDNALQDLKEASGADDVSKANRAKQIITAIFTDYWNNLL